MQIAGWIIAALIILLWVPSAAIAVRASEQPTIHSEADGAAEAQRLDNEAARLAELGRFDEAIELARRALTIRERVLGAEHPDTAPLLLGILLLQNGDLPGGRSCFDRVLAIREQEVGSQHPDMAVLLNRLGMVLEEMGDLAGARLYMERALAVVMQVFGPHHPNTAIGLNNLGLLAQQMGDLADAERYLEKALAIREEVLIPDHPDTANSLNSLGFLLLEMGNVLRATAYFDRVIAIRERTYGSRNPEVATYLTRIGLALREHDDLPSARAYLERALEILEEAFGEENPNVAVGLSNLGTVLLDMEDFTGAQVVMERALGILERNDPYDSTTASVLNSLGSLFQAMKDPERAKRYFERALVIYERAPSEQRANEAMTLDNLAVLHQEIGDWAHAKLYFERALAAFEDSLGSTHPRTGTTVNELGLLLLAMGNLSKAEPYFERALAISEQTYGRVHPSTAAALNNLGLLLKSRGDLAAAKPYYEEALRIRNTVLGPEDPETAQSLNNLAVLLADLGDFEGARSRHEKALLIRIGALGLNHPDTAVSLNNMGLLGQATGDYPGAKLYHERALAIREKVLGPEHPDTATSLNNLGLALQAIGDYPGASLYHERALAIREKVLGPEHPDTASSLNSLGAVLGDMGELPAAKRALKRAVSVEEASLGPVHPKTRVTLLNLALVYWAIGDIDSALEYQTRLLDAEEEALGATLRIGTQQQKQMFLDTFAVTSAVTVSLHVDTAPSDARARRLALTTILRRKGRVLDATVEGLRYLRENLSPENQKLFDSLNELRETKAYLLLRPPAEDSFTSESRARIAELEERIAIAEARLSTTSAAFRDMAATVTLEFIQAGIPEQAALVEFFVYRPSHPTVPKPARSWGEEHYVAYVLQRSGDPEWVPLGPATTVDEAAHAFIRSVSHRGTDVLERSRELDALTMAKIRPYLGETDALVISPDSLLNLVPFASLVDEQDRYLIERYKLSYVTSGRDLMRSASIVAKKEAALLMGGASFGGDFGSPDTRGDGMRAADMSELEFGPLPGTAKEVRAIGRILGVPKERVLTGEAANEAAVKAVRGPHILHLATHGFFLPDRPEPPLPDWRGTPPQMSGPRLEDPLLRSGLALSGFNRRHDAANANDGVLTAQEVAGLDLWGTEIVTLSACETGLGEVRTGEGVFGLRRALVLAGARTQVMTLWKVADEPTKDQMVSWYEQLEKGVGRSEAMHQVQLAALRGDALPVTKAKLRGMRRDSVSDEDADPRIQGSRHPYYWASFILSGETGSIAVGNAGGEQ